MTTTKDRGPEARVSKKSLVVYVAVMLVVVAVLLVPYLVMTSVAHGIGEGAQRAFTPAGKGVVVRSCAPTRNGRAAITGTAHNDTAVSSDFFIGVSVTDASGTQNAEANAIASNVAPGKTVGWTTTTPAHAEGLMCDLSTVLRTPHPLI